jgi:hypothetical protein
MVNENKENSNVENKENSNVMATVINEKVEKNTKNDQEKELLKEVTKVKSISYDDIFITENDTFDIKILYYKKDDKLFVESVDQDFLTHEGFNP